MSADERFCKVESLEFGEFQLRPGSSLRLGRHSENDIVLASTMVSRFHARITWDREMDRPAIFDNGSQNGTFVDGELVKTATPLRDQCRVTIGPFALKVILLGCGETPALLKDTNDMVTLFSDDGPDLRGEVSEGLSVRDLLQRLEAERRTGTLKFELPTGQAEVTYCLGRIMSATNKDGQGLRALERILQSRSGSFRFSRELEPLEESLNLWVSDYLRSRSLDPGDTTQKFKRTQRAHRPSGPYPLQ